MAAPRISPQSPFRIDLDQQRKRAKELCRDRRAGDPAAADRFRRHHPAANRHGHDRPVSLADAQLVIARELGLPSWPRLRTHVALLDRARRAMTRAAAPDGDRPTLHIRCGSDLEPALREAGFGGAFLEYSNPLCQGPVTGEPDHLATRARFLAHAYGAPLGLTEAALLARLERAEEALARAHEYERVLLWFEHDSYDQLILARCLAKFAEHGPPPLLELISVNSFPGSARFIGLGQLPAEAIRHLWTRRRPVSAASLSTGRRVWEALRCDDPRPLATLAAPCDDGLPDLPRALRRHLQELPWTGDGLGLTERLTLALACKRPGTLGSLFRDLMREVEPLPWLGDIMFRAIVEAMAAADDPPLTIRRAAEIPWPQWPVEPTAAGRQVLAGLRDALALRPPERWVGGVAIRPDGPNWRWDERAERPVRM